MADIKQLAVDASNEAFAAAIKTAIATLTTIWITADEGERKKALAAHRHALQLHKDIHTESLAAIDVVFTASA